jgi:predicted XRE-type DNA-binding protein
MSQQRNHLTVANEAQLEVALQAIKRDATLSQRRAAAIYRVSQSTLSDRLAGKQFRRDCTPNSKKML